MAAALCWRRLTLPPPGPAAAAGAGALGSVFEIYNDGGSGVQPTLRITDGTHTMLALTDTGDTARLEVTGDGVFGSQTAVGDRSLTVQSGGAASVSVGPQRDTSTPSQTASLQ